MKHSNLARVFKALSNEQRLQLFLMIYEGCQTGAHSKGEKGPCCRGAMEKAFSTACGCMNISRSTISHHFNELQDAGLIKATRKGQSFVCEVNQDAVKVLRNFLE